MDCKNLSCPFRSNQTSSIYHCDCELCPRAQNQHYTAMITTNHTMTDLELQEYLRQLEGDHTSGC